MLPIAHDGMPTAMSGNCAGASGCSMPHYVLPGPRVRKSELVGSNTDDRPVAPVESKHVKGAGAAHVGEGVGDAGRAVEEGAGEVPEGMEEEVVEDVEEDVEGELVGGLDLAI